MCSMDWFEVLKTAAAVTAPIIGFFALRNWQRQDKAKRDAEFLNDLIKAAHAYITEMSTPLTVWRMIKIGIDAHAPTWEQGDETEKAVKGAIAYIEKNGEREAKRAFEALAKARPAVVALQSLIAWGQVFKFDNYTNATNAVRMLVWHFDKLEAFTAFVGSTNMYWSNPQIQKSLKDLIAIDTDAMIKNMQENDVALITFARATYAEIYG